MTVAYIVDHCGELFQGHCRHFTIHDCDFELAFLDWLRISVTMPFYWKGYPKSNATGFSPAKVQVQQIGEVWVEFATTPIINCYGIIDTGGMAEGT